eukprot:gene1760-16243_t
MPKDEGKKYRAQRYRKDLENESWARNWLNASRKGSSKAHCRFCDKNLAAGKSEIIAHTKTALHVKLAKNVKTNKSLNTFFEVKNDDKIKAELSTVALIARRNLPLNFLDHLMETLNFVADDSKAKKVADTMVK